MAPVGSLNQATAYESPAHSSTGTRNRLMYSKDVGDKQTALLPDSSKTHAKKEVGCRDSQEVCLEAATLERVRNSSLIERSCAEDARAKRSAEAVGCKKTSVGERSALVRSLRASRGGRSGSENVGLSNANIGENPMPRKPKGSSARVRRVEKMPRANVRVRGATALK
nr:unnamed protein product [Ipomoea trifida]